MDNEERECYSKKNGRENVIYSVKLSKFARKKIFMEENKYKSTLMNTLKLLKVQIFCPEQLHKICTLRGNYDELCFSHVFSYYRKKKEKKKKKMAERKHAKEKGKKDRKKS